MGSFELEEHKENKLAGEVLPPELAGAAVVNCSYVSERSMVYTARYTSWSSITGCVGGGPRESDVRGV